MNHWSNKGRLAIAFILAVILLFPPSLLAQVGPRLGIAPLQSKALSQSRITELQLQLQLAYERMGTYRVVSQSQMNEVVTHSSPCIGYECARSWSEKLDVAFLVFPTLGTMNEQLILTLSLIQRGQPQVVGQGAEILPADFGELNSLLDQLVARSQPLPMLPSNALMLPGGRGPLGGALPESKTPFYRTWWFWTVVGAMSLLGTYAYISQEPPMPSPNP